jgi:hypothetical protein
MANPAAILQTLEVIRAETLKCLEPLTQADLDWRPPVTPENSDGWSLGEMFHHIALDEHYLREHLARPLLEGVAPPAGIQYIPPPPAYGLSKEALLFWFQRARIMTRRLLVAEWPPAANLDLRHSGGLAEIFGGPPMNSAEWLEGFGGHEAFHQKQILATINRLAERVLT